MVDTPRYAGTRITAPTRHRVLPFSNRNIPLLESSLNRCKETIEARSDRNISRVPQIPCGTKDPEPRRTRGIPYPRLNKRHIKQASIVNSLPLAYDALRPAVISWRVPCGASQASLGSPRSAETHHTVRELIPVTITMNSAMISPRPNRSWNFELKEKLRWPLPHKLYAPMKK